MERYDIAIIGTGPAGLEAAITAKLRNKNILLLGMRNLSVKVEKAHTVKNYLGFSDIAGEDMQTAFLNHIDNMGIEITEDRINTVYAMGEYFMLQGHAGNYEALSVILACGMTVAKPYEGELENLGRGVSYCATCDAALYRNKSAVVIASSKEEEKEAEFLAEIADKVYYIPLYDEAPHFSDKVNEKIEINKGKKPVRIERKDQKISLEYEYSRQENDKQDNYDAKAEVAVNECVTADSIEADGCFILRESVAPSQLVPGLVIENNQVVVDRAMKTNIVGLFACGDITGAPYQYIKAAGEGNVAALSAVNYLAEK